jgi:hypothetical protein
MSDEPQDPKPRRGIPLWVFVASLIAVVMLTGSVVWALRVRSQAGTPVVDTSVPTSTASVDPTLNVQWTPINEPSIPPAAPSTSTAPATATPPAARVLDKQPARVTHMTWSASKGYRITADYVQILTGRAAADAATAAGEESPPPNDYFIANTSAKLRTYSLPKATPITMLGWAGADATAKHKIAVGQFMDVMPGGVSPQEEYADAYYYLTIKNGTTVTKVEMIFFP